MAGFTVSPKAARDLIEIWKYIGRDSVEHADALYARFYEVFLILSREPRLGPASDEIQPGTRRFPVGNYIIYYRIRRSSVQILHVFHGKRDQRNALTKP